MMLINWYSTPGQGEGYSGASENILAALEEIGVDARVLAYRKILQQNLTDRGKLAINKPFVKGKIGVSFGYPNAFNSIINDVKIGFTMFETNKLPNGKGFRDEGNTWAGVTGDCADMINALDELWVPSEHNKGLFEASGVEIPVSVIPLGVNQHLFYDFTKEREKTRKERPFTFLMLGTLTSRKNVGAVITAFMDLFSGNDDVRLVIKSKSGTIASLQFPKGINIEIIDENSTVKQVQDYYKNADCFVFPSRGEGFGLPPLEAMATGLPTIFACNTGMADYANEKYNYPIRKHELVKATRYPKKWGDVGTWYEPSLVELKEKMYDVYCNEEKAKKKGKLAAGWVEKNWTYTKTAFRILERLRKFNS